MWKPVQMDCCARASLAVKAGKELKSLVFFIYENSTRTNGNKITNKAHKIKKKKQKGRD